MGIVKATPAKAAPAKAPVAAAKPGVKPAPAAAKPAATPAPLITGQAGKLSEQKLTVTTTVLQNGTILGQPVEESEIEVRVFATTPAMAVAGIKIKKNLGNYEAVEIFASQSVPAYVEDLDSVQQQVNENILRLVDERFASFDPAAFGLGQAAGVDNDFANLTGGEGEAETDAEGQPEGEAAAEEGITADWIAAAERPDLEAVMEANPELFSFTADEYPEDDDLRSMMSAELFPEGEEGAEGDADAGEEEITAYTQEILDSYSMEDLAQVFEAWQMGAFPKYNAKNEALVKKNAIKKILELQDNPA